MEKLEKEQRDLSQKAAAVDQTIANLMGEIQKLEAKAANLRHILEQSAKEQVSKKAALEQRGERTEALAETLPSMRLDVEGLQMLVDRLQEEVGTKLSATLSAGERVTLTKLHAEQKEVSRIEQISAPAKPANTRSRSWRRPQPSLSTRSSQLRRSTNSNSTQRTLRSSGRSVCETMQHMLKLDLFSCGCNAGAQSVESLVGSTTLSCKARAASLSRR